MEKRSRYYLTKEATNELWNIRWNGRDEDEEETRRESYSYARRRKGILTALSDLEDKRGVVAVLQRLQLNFNLLIHNSEFKIQVWWMQDYPTLQRVNRVVAQDLGKIGVH